MPDEERPKTKTLDEAEKKFSHVREYLVKLQERKIPQPDFYEDIDRSFGSVKEPNLIYAVGDPIFIHIYKGESGEIEYNVIETRLEEDEQELYDKVMDRLVDLAYLEEVPPQVNKIGKVLITLLDKAVIIGKKDRSFLNPRINITQEQYDKIKYYLLRNRVGYGKLEPLFYDPHLEDIHCTGIGQVTTIHKIFGLVHTNIIFDKDQSLDKYIVDVTERVERPASDAKSVVDAIMPDGSRGNFIYGRDISLEGSSFTVRKFAADPISITQLINWGTVSCELAAYLWIALENGMNLFVCGETASGKTTLLNAIAAFIKPDDKVFTVENTPEVTMPHDVWQHLVTRESGKDSDVTYLDLLIAALRSRPNYIIVGEIRGEEGNIAFQAMQTGHPVMSTFHAGNVQTMIQRITGHPINVPITFVDNLNLCLIQQAVHRDGKFIRRCLSLSELERYYAPEDKIITREVFTWNSIHDTHLFRGLFNSYILEQKIAKILGYKDPRLIYNEMDIRTKILERMIEEEIFDYNEVWEVIKAYHYKGAKGLPFKL